MKPWLIPSFMGVLREYALSEKAKNDLMSVVMPDDFEYINDCVIRISNATANKLIDVYGFAYNMAVFHGWTKNDFMQYTKIATDDNEEAIT